MRLGIVSRVKHFLYVTLRITKYKILSNCKRVTGKPLLYHPVLLSGEGEIIFKSKVQIGVKASPNFYSHYTYIEAKNAKSTIIIGNNVAINNGFSAIALSGIIIEDNVLIGVNCSIIDTDGHFLTFDKRNVLEPPSMPVHIKENVFLGSNVVILKGVTIGQNSVIGNGSVVTKNIPDNVVAAGNPARVIRNL